jgi:hypothetical protein
MFETIPVGRRARWQLMKLIIQKWMRPLTPADGFTPEELDGLEASLGCRLPKTLREWYQLAGKAEDIWCCQDCLSPPFLDRELLVFCFENQGIWRMGMRRSDLGRVDPPVFGWMNEAFAEPGEFGQLNASLSECALQYLAWSMKWANGNPRFACHIAREDGGPYSGYGWWGPATLDAIERHCARCAFPVWRLMERDTVFYERQGLLIQVGHQDAGGGDPDLYVSVRTQGALADFERMVRGTEFRWAAGGWYTD